jgi:hypothetical protein
VKLTIRFDDEVMSILRKILNELQQISMSLTYLEEKQ